MKESEYVTASNLARLQAAQTIIGQCLPDYGITKEELRELISKLEAITEQIAEGIKVEE